MISFRQKGNFKKTERYLQRVRYLAYSGMLDSYGRKGVEALKSATPIDSGMTAESWYYKIDVKPNSVTIGFYNSNIQNGVPIAVILQYGHGTKNGGWVEGRDYINPAIQSIFDEITERIWKEVTRL